MATEPDFVEYVQSQSGLGSKLYFRLDEQLEDRDLLRKALVTTARALPLPKPKPASGKTAKPPGGKPALARPVKSRPRNA